ncbi:MAG: hypothetical protein ACM3ML_24650 [Micromonosporaceae bacterium]
MTSSDGRHRAELAQRYAFDEWAGRSTTRDAVLCLEVLLPSIEVDGLTIEHAEELPATGHARRGMRYIYAAPGSRAMTRVVIEMLEADSLRQAHECLLDLLAQSMAPRLPRCEAQDLAVGDVCFGSHDPTRPSVVFSRHNVVVTVRSAGVERLDVGTFAAYVDSEVARETVSDRAPRTVPPPVIRRVDFSTMSPSVGEQVSLSLDVAGQRGEAVMTKIVATGGTLERAGTQVVLRPDQPGSQRINVLVVNAAGAGAEETFVIQVE